MHIHSILWSLGHFIFKVRSHLGIKHESVDGDVGAAGICLHGCGHKALWEEEGRGPVCAHSAVLDPLTEEHYSFDEIGNPGGERL